MKSVALGIIAGALATLAIAAPSAVAFNGYSLVDSFDGSGSTTGPFSCLTRIAVNQQSHRVLAMDNCLGVVDQFDASGQPVAFPALGKTGLDGSNTPEGSWTFSNEVDIAVDNSGGPTQGNIYVLNETGPIWAFDSQGNFLWELTTNLGDTCGLSTDSAGHIWVGSYSLLAALEFDNNGGAGQPPSQIGEVDDPLGSPCHIAVGNDGTVYMNHYQGAVVGVNGSTVSTLDEGGAFGVRVNPVNGHVFVLHPDQFFEYDPTSGAVVGRGAPGVLGSAGGIDVDGNSGEVYVADQGHIDIYGSPTVFADASTDDASSVLQNTATLTGHVDPSGGGTISACEFQYGTDASYGQSVDCTPGAPLSTPADVSADLTGLLPDTTYHYTVTATDPQGDNSAPDRTFTTPPAVLDVSTDGSSNIGKTTATLSGSYTGDGHDTSYHFEYGTDDSYGHSTPTVDKGTGSGHQSVSADITGLTGGTDYHFRLVATNTFGNAFGPDQTLTTLPTITDLTENPASAVARTTASLSAAFNPAGDDAHYYFEYGLTTSYGSQSNPAPGPDAGGGGAIVPVGSDLAGLQAGQTYHYRVVVTEASGIVKGDDLTFTTLPAVQSLSTGGTTNVTQTTATLNGSFEGDGSDTSYYFEWGGTAHYGNTTPTTDAGSPTGTTAASADITGLTLQLPSTKPYHFRLVATNGLGTSFGPDQTFYAAPPLPPAIAATSSSNVAPTTATVGAMVNPSSGDTIVRFEYGTDTSYGSTTQYGDSIGADEVDHPVSALLTGLAPGTTYHFRAVALNFGGVSHGTDQTFTTTGVAPVPTGSSGQGPITQVVGIKGPPATLHCSKKQVLKNGRCVAKRKPKRKHHHRRHGGHHHG